MIFRSVGPSRCWSNIWAAMPPPIKIGIMVMAIKNQLKRYNIKTMLVQGRGEDSLDEHSKILSALERHDADGAETQMRRHIASLRTVLRKHFELLL